MMRTRRGSWVVVVTLLVVGALAGRADATSPEAEAEGAPPPTVVLPPGVPPPAEEKPVLVPQPAAPAEDGSIFTEPWFWVAVGGGLVVAFLGALVLTERQGVNPNGTDGNAPANF